jgi:hypothetical protein
VHRDAYAHDLFHQVRTGEKSNVVPLLRVGRPPRLVIDDCPLCDRRDCVVERTGLCPHCSPEAA